MIAAWNVERAHLTRAFTVHRDVAYSKFTGWSSENAFHGHSDEVETGYNEIELITELAKWLPGRIIGDKSEWISYDTTY